jgi:hypothetical protein
MSGILWRSEVARLFAVTNNGFAVWGFGGVAGGDQAARHGMYAHKGPAGLRECSGV